ncbi:energy transducer TonB [Thaumasiovibrio subtropicus]|uniref:energy transducer TonB n=1 Tax=Thaumasiovibrio subtropicus TaxID=1891207 RepID=UPI000B364422|nr:energy transducer TonB [Thaumasiovibrio subtropicus]
MTRIFKTMNLRRYITSGAVALLIHGVAFPDQKPHLVIGPQSDTDGHTIALTFAAPAAQKPTIEPIKAEPELNQPAETPEQPLNEPEIQPTPEDVPPEPIPEPEPEKVRPVPQENPQPKPVQEKPKREPVAEEQPQDVEKEVVEEEIENTAVEEINDASPTEVTQQETNFAQSAPAKLIENPTFSTKPGPVNYPRQARRRGMQGTVWLDIELDVNASIRNIVIADSSGHDVLDDAAIKDVAKWHFSPYLENGHPIAYRVRVPVRFKLN